jgi:hypothetical protein
VPRALDKFNIFRPLALRFFTIKYLMIKAYLKDDFIGYFRFSLLNGCCKDILQKRHKVSGSLNFIKDGNMNMFTQILNGIRL